MIPFPFFQLYYIPRVLDHGPSTWLSNPCFLHYSSDPCSDLPISFIISLAGTSDHYNEPVTRFLKIMNLRVSAMAPCPLAPPEPLSCHEDRDSSGTPRGNLED